MSKKSMVIAGIVALVVIAIAAALLLTSRNTSSPTASTTGTTPNTTSSATATGSGIALGQAATASPATTGTVKTPRTANPHAGAAVTEVGPFPALPNPKIPAQSAEAPAAPGQMLAPLTDAPGDTISALKAGSVPEGAQYSIVMRPYGIGPSIVLGSRLAVRVDSAKPVNKAPAYSRIVKANLLVLVDTTRGGTVTKGGAYRATLTFRSDGTKLLPILSNAKAVQ